MPLSIVKTYKAIISCLDYTQMHVNITNYN